MLFGSAASVVDLSQPDLFSAVCISCAAGFTAVLAETGILFLNFTHLDWSSENALLGSLWL